MYNKLNTKTVKLSPEKQAEQQTLFKKKKIEQLVLTEDIIEEKISKDDIDFFIKKGDSTYSNRNVQETLPDSITNNAKEIDEALRDIKVCDPAIGSGAFPVGMMNEIVRARATLSNHIGESDRPLYELKRNAIEQSIYGVDIDPGAVEIAKLRFWLSLVVDEENTTSIKPLPNLDFKIMQGNSLITSYEGIDFDDFVTSTVRKHYFEGQKLNEVIYEKDGVSIPLLELRNSDYKFEKMPEKVRAFVKTGEVLDYAQKDYDNFDVNQFRKRLDFFANGGVGENEEILSKIIDFDGCDFTPEDTKFLTKFLRELDAVRVGKKSIAEAVEYISEQDIAPKGTNKLNEIARQKAEEDIKIRQKVSAELSSVKKDFDNVMNILYQNDLADIANSCAVYRPKHIENCEDAKYLISLINKNIDKETKKLNRDAVEQSIMRWDTYNFYKSEGKTSDEVLAKAERFARQDDGSIDIDKAGQYLINSEIVKMYPESLKYSKYPDILEKIMEKTATSNESIKYICRYEDYMNLSSTEKAQLSNFIDMFDQKNYVNKAILKSILEQDYLNVDTPVQIKTSGTEAVTATFSAKAKKAIADKYKYPTCITYLKDFENALANFAGEWGSSGIKKTGKNNNALRYKMELKVTGKDDRLFSSNNDYYFDVFSDKGFH